MSKYVVVTYMRVKFVMYFYHAPVSVLSASEFVAITSVLSPPIKLLWFSIAVDDEATESDELVRGGWPIELPILPIMLLLDDLDEFAVRPPTCFLSYT